MNQTVPSAKHVVAQLIAALKSERMLRSDFYTDAALQAWFGPHKRSSAPSPLKAGVQREVLDFGVLRLDLARVQSGGAFSFSAVGGSPKGLTDLSADDLIALLGAPGKQVDFIAEQTRSKSVVPAASPGELPISPPPVRTRGKTTHPMGNRDVSGNGNQALSCGTDSQYQWRRNGGNAVRPTRSPLISVLLTRHHTPNHGKRSSCTRVGVFG
ncbi:MAG: hypothetical protein R3E56_06870 [Burkholderiaceae bacterium]